MSAIYLVDKTILPDHLILVRKAGNKYSVACHRTGFEWEEDSYYCAPFSGMDTDYRDISETDALALLAKFRSKVK